MSHIVSEKGMTRTQKWVLGITSVASLMVTLDALVVLTALDAIRRDLGASLEHLEWTVTGYTLSFSVLLMPAAALGERFGRRKLLVAGISLFSVASAACALAPGVGWLIAARLVQGFGAAAVMPVALAVLSSAFPPKRRGPALGVFASVTGLATLGGPLVGGAVVEAAAWQWIFWLNVPIGLVLVPLVRRHVTEDFGATRRLDIVGMALVAVVTFGLVWALVRGNAVGWDSPQVIGALAAGVAGIVGFVAWESRRAEPLLPVRFFGLRGFAAGNAATFSLFGSMFGVVFFLAQFLQIVQHNGPLGAGLRLAPLTVTLSVVARLAGTWINRFGERNLVVAGLAAQAVGFGWIAWAASPESAYPVMIFPLVLAGAGASLAIPAAQSAVLAAVPASATGAASGTFNTVRQLGASFGVAIAAASFGARGGYASPAMFSAGFVPATASMAGLAALGVLAATVLPAHVRPAGT